MNKVITVFLLVALAPWAKAAWVVDSRESVTTHTINHQCLGCEPNIILDDRDDFIGEGSYDSSLGFQRSNVESGGLIAFSSEMVLVHPGSEFGYDRATSTMQVAITLDSAYHYAFDLTSLVSGTAVYELGYSPRFSFTLRDAAGVEIWSAHGTEANFENPYQYTREDVLLAGSYILDFDVFMAAGSVCWGCEWGSDIAMDFTLTPQEVPLPAAAWLFLSAITGLCAMQRRRRR